MITLTEVFIISGVLAVVMLAAAVVLARGRRSGVARTSSVFKTGNLPSPVECGRVRSASPVT